MKNLYKKTASTIFLTILLTFFLASCTTEKEPAPPVKNTIQKEMLIVKDMGEGMSFYTVGWCGNTGLIVDNDKFGKKWVGLNKDSVKLTTKSINYITGCTPDGKWIIYEGSGTSRIYKDKWGKSSERLGLDGPGWHGQVFDIGRYEIATGKHQKFAVVRDDSGGLVSPDMTKVLLGNKHDSDLKPIKRRWEEVWLTNEWVYGFTRWFADSSGVATLIWGNGHSLGIEIFDKENGWAKEYDFGSLGFGYKPNHSIYFRAIDKDNRLYFTVIEGGEDYGTSKFRFFRCEIKDRKITCKKTGEFNENGRHINSHEILPNGDFIFSRDNDNCIHRLKPGRPNAECIADLHYGDDAYYEDIYLIAASPDGRQIAFRRGKRPPEPKGQSYKYQYDLFVKKLSKD
jgi:hypothetical protein